MAFTDFKTISEVQERFTIRYEAASFVQINPVEPNPTLVEELAFIEEYIDTRVSEFSIREGLIFPVLKEAYRRYAEKFSLWSHRFIKYDDVLLGTPDYYTESTIIIGLKINRLIIIQTKKAHLRKV
ncbi:MAG: hypothetical protein DYG89_06595 [Caldilinea sp. CFX5]|nr:hypothetical protein [Caldilinea sp. CFX5]